MAFWILFTGVSASDRGAGFDEFMEPQEEYHNIFMLKNYAGQVLSLAVFMALDDLLKAKHMLWTITLCCSFYMHITLVMVTFGINEYFDVPAGFLAASLSSNIIVFFEIC